ncbi:MAG: diaminopimelate decarboxylase [Gammaproteobacteria bacterium]|nr:MAG: diaminopimelate decarboxylase [Gammaproteobacteria bacterium]
MTQYFPYRDGCLFAEELSLESLAEHYGTPCYIYSRSAIEDQWKRFNRALKGIPHQICYAVKANSSLAVLQLMSHLGSGFDIVSGGELERVIRAGGDPSKVVFSGVGKRRDEIEQALHTGIPCFNVESAGEIERIAEIAQRLEKKAPVSLRVNPDVDPKTHPYIATGLRSSKFGIAMQEAEHLYQELAGHEWVEVVGVDCHIGSQLLDLDPMYEALDKIMDLVARLRKKNINIRHLDMGGGFGICYQDEDEPSLDSFGRKVKETLAGTGLALIIEPGRAMVGNAGILLTQVEFLKTAEEKSFAIVDAAMNDLPRPSLYDAWHDIRPVHENSSWPLRTYDVVGPVCESGDFLGKERSLRIEPGSLLAVSSAGAYGFVMSSNYNTRPRPAEIMVDQDRSYLIRERESLDDLLHRENLIPEW